MDGLVKIKYKSSEDNICSICLNNMTSTKSSITLPCRHSFHKCCINKDLLHRNLQSSNNYHCPICRSRTSCKLIKHFL